MKRLLLLGVVFSLLLTGCGSYTVPSEKQETDIVDSSTKDNPFENNGENIIGEIGHGPNEVNWTADGEMLPFDYEGGEFSLSYHYSASGRADSVGFLLYLNGEPQPYRADGMEELSYCHAFPVEGNTEKDITFRFTPVKGNTGDTLGLTILSIYYPNFKPDMVESSSYGFYQGILSNQVPVRFLADPPETTPLVTGLEASDLKTRDEKITKDFLENELPANGVMDVEAIEEWPYYTISYDGKLVLDNINLSGKEDITVRYKLCGPERTKMNTVFYLDHQPVSFQGTFAQEARLTKGGVWVVDITLDANMIQDASTFYAISVPVEYGRSETAIKTNSILFYKES